MVVLVACAIACTRHPPAAAPRACAPGEAVLLGACVVRAPAEACGRGRARDLDRGGCATSRDVRGWARAGGIFVGDEDVVACDSDADELVVRSGRLACVAGRGATAAPACPPGSVRDGPSCAPLLVDGLVDLARFARAAAAYVCDAVAAEPSIAGPTEERFQVEVALHAPDNDPTQATAVVRTTPALADADLERPSGAVLDALRRGAAPPLEGASPTSTALTNATDVSAVVACSRSSRRPKSAPQAQPE